jgi:hypothetical protein
MKNNKYAPYILGPVLLLIWGLVFYKIYQAVYGGEENFVVPQFQAMPVFEGTQQDSSFALLLDYKDPFFGKKFSSNSKNSSSRRTSSQTSNRTPKRNTPKTEKPIIEEPIPKKPFPPIVYQGYQTMNLDTIALLKINGRFYPNTHKEEVMQGVQVLGIYKDSIQLLFDGQHRTFRK